MAVDYVAWRYLAIKLHLPGDRRFVNLISNLPLGLIMDFAGFRRSLVGLGLEVAPGRIDQLGLELRKVGLLPASGRGNGSVDIGPTHAANVLLSLCAPTVEAAARFVTRWRDCKADGTKLDGAGKLGDAFDAILAGESAVDSITVLCDWPQAIIRTSNGKEYSFGNPAAARKDGFSVGPMRKAIQFSGIFAQIAAELAGDIDDKPARYREER